MRRTMIAAFSPFLLLAMAGPALAQPAALPTQAEIQADYDAAKYADAVKKITRVLPLKGEAAAAYDRSEILKLKAESHLRLNQVALAADTFNLLARDTKDEKDQALFKATGLLIRKSKANKYLPRSGDAKAGPKTPIDILEPEPRKTALAALYADETPPTVARVEAARKAGTLPRIIEMTGPIADLRVLELASTGADAATGKMLGDLSTTAKDLMTDALKSMTLDVKDISERANKVESEDRPRTDGTRYTINRRKGLTTKDKAALNDTMTTCQQIVGVTDELAAALKAQASDFAAVKQEADLLSREANKVLTDDYDLVNREDIPRRTPRY